MRHGSGWTGTRSRELADRLPHGRYRVLSGTAHQPYLEQPATIAELITDAVLGPGKRGVRQRPVGQRAKKPWEGEEFCGRAVVGHSGSA